jgi:nicotinamide-nucleotide amidase
MRTDDITDLAEQLAEAVRDRGLLVATAESLTGGRLAADLARAPGASDWFAGAVVAYMRQVKYDVLDVPRGPVVSSTAAEAMTANVARLLGADLAVGVTGVGGPDEQDGQPPGTVWFGLHAQGRTRTSLTRFEGEPDDVVTATRRHAIVLLLSAARAVPAGAGRAGER